MDNKCITCGDLIKKESNVYKYNLQYLKRSSLCENCFHGNDLSHLNDLNKSKIQCSNWGVEENCLRYFHLLSVNELAKRTGRDTIKKYEVGGPKKLMEKGLCINCYDETFNKENKVIQPNPNKVKKVSNKRSYRLEDYRSWERADNGKVIFYVYIQLLNDGDYYVGQTGDIRTRLFQHTERHNTKGTMHKNPKFVFYETFPTREIACYREYELKQLNENNQQKLDRLISEFIHINELIQKSNDSNHRTFVRKIFR